MRMLRRISLGFVLTIGIASAALAQKVTTDYDKGTDFAQYKTFMWIKEPKTTNPLMRQRVIDDINAELTAKGLQLVTSGPVCLKRLDVGPVVGELALETGERVLPRRDLRLELLELARSRRTCLSSWLRATCSSFWLLLRLRLSLWL